MIADKYRIDAFLAEGGMGVIARATHVHLQQAVAIKFLLGDAYKESGTTARFLREARAAAQIRSEHVARVSDMGTLPSGEPYMVMELLEGHDLAEHLEQHGSLAMGESVDFVLQACEALAEAHALGTVHRDLKPANFFLTTRADGSPLVKVLDFGVSKLLTPSGEGDVGITAPQEIMGSPMYMAPEQIRNARSVDTRADIWSLGVILHELLTGHAPFDADTVSAVLAQIVADPPIPLRKAKPELPEALEGVILRCLDKRVEARFQDVGELAGALAPFAPQGAALSVARIAKVVSTIKVTQRSRRAAERRQREEAARAQGVVARTQAAGSWEAGAGIANTAPSLRRRRTTTHWLAAAALALGAAAALALGFTLARRGSEPEPERETQTDPSHAASAPVAPPAAPEASSAGAARAGAGEPRAAPTDAGEHAPEAPRPATMAAELRPRPRTRRAAGASTPAAQRRAPRIQPPAAAGDPLDGRR